MRIAIIDLLFSWPPRGGADVDVYHVARELLRLGYEVHLFTVREGGAADPAILPFPVTSLDFGSEGLSEKRLQEGMCAHMDRYRPDLVFLAQAYFLKVPLIEALGRYRVVSRCYAHETACHKDILRFRDGAPCPNSYLKTPDTCRHCAIDQLGNAIRNGSHTAWIREYLATRAWTESYYGRFLQAMKRLAAVIITTEHMREQVRELNDTIVVIPHAVDIQRFSPIHPPAENQVPILFVPGRIEDPAKGFGLLLEAARRLADAGLSFEVRATLPEGYDGPPWLRPVGKLDYDAMPEAYRQADLCVVPSLWEEPFGLVALEAMASGLPVCAARTGGLQDIVVHGKTGFLFERGNAKALAACLEKLLEAPALRHQFGQAGRRRVVEGYAWEKTVTEYYPCLFNKIG